MRLVIKWFKSDIVGSGSGGETHVKDIFSFASTCFPRVELYRQCSWY